MKDGAKLPAQPRESAERFKGVTYGRSPAMQALDDAKAINALPQEERGAGVVAFMKWLLRR